MELIKLLHLMLMSLSISWTNIEVEVPVYANITEYIEVPEARLIVNGVIVEDPDMYYVINGVDNNYLRDVNTNYLGIVRYSIKAVFPNYFTESKQEIVFNVVDKIKPEVVYVPAFKISIGQTIPDLTIGLEFRDNFDSVEDISVKIVGKDTINNKKIGKYPFMYQLIDKSGNVLQVSSVVEVVDVIPPEINKIKDLIIELGDSLIINNFYKITDDHDNFVEVKIDISGVDFLQIGQYPIKIVASDQSGNQTIKHDLLKIVYSGSPLLELHLNNLVIEVNSGDLEFQLFKNIKKVDDKIDHLTVSDVIITHYASIDMLGTYDVKYEITNSINKTTIKNIKLTINDTTRPVVEVIKPLEIAVNSNNIIYSQYFYIADNYDDYSDLSISYNEKIDLKKIGSYPIKIEVTDKSKNKLVWDGVFVVVDNEKPIFSNQTLEPIEIEVFNSFDFKTLKPVDNYNPNPVIIPTEYYFKEIGRFEIAVEIKDQSNNITKEIITFIVVDNETPQIFLTVNEIKLGLQSGKLNPMEYIHEVYDNYDYLKITDVVIYDEIQYDQIGIYQIHYYLSDSSNNETVESITVFIDDTEKPVIKTKNVSVKKGDLNFSLLDGVEYYDNDDKLDLIIFDSGFDVNVAGSYRITYIVTDTRGNSAKTERIITVVDNDSIMTIALMISGSFLVIGAITIVIYIYFGKKRRF